MNQSVSSWIRMNTGKRIKTSRAKRGFTLVELLVVISIIILLVGLLLPAIMGVRASFERSASKFEVQALDNAVENYRGKYGDYPPDGSSWTITERHLRKAFPNILSSELSLLKSYDIDPAEALVFYLGGFSSDTQRPFTGKGGPLTVIGGTPAAPICQYNSSRENSFFEFPPARLTLSPDGTASLDEATLFKTGKTNDPFPVFMGRLNTKEAGVPYVYFDSRTYASVIGGTTLVPIFNFYQPSNVLTVTDSTVDRFDLGAVRPYLAEVTSAGAFKFENSKTFQIIAPGIDGRYGGRLAYKGQQWFSSSGGSKGKSFTYDVPTKTMVPDTDASKKLQLDENLPVQGLEQPAHNNISNFTDTPTIGESAG